MVTTTGTVGVEVFSFYTMVDQVLASRAVYFDVTSRGDVIRRNGIAHKCKSFSCFNISDIIKNCAQVREERRLLDVCGVRVELVQIAFWNLNLVETFVSTEYIAVFVAEHVRAHSDVKRILNLLVCRPDVFQVNRLTVVAITDWIFRKVDVHCTSKRISNN
ncbi:hypothetical protein D3C85_829850 [compost metagenome]